MRWWRPWEMAEGGGEESLEDYWMRVRPCVRRERGSVGVGVVKKIIYFSEEL